MRGQLRPPRRAAAAPCAAALVLAGSLAGCLGPVSPAGWATAPKIEAPPRARPRAIVMEPEPASPPGGDASEGAAQLALEAPLEPGPREAVRTWLEALAAGSLESMARVFAEGATVEAGGTTLAALQLWRSRLERTPPGLVARAALADVPRARVVERADNHPGQAMVRLEPRVTHGSAGRVLADVLVFRVAPGASGYRILSIREEIHE